MLTPSRNILNYTFSEWHQFTSGKDLIHSCVFVLVFWGFFISIHRALESYLWNEHLATWAHLLEHIINSYTLGIKTCRNTMVLKAGKKTEINNNHSRHNLSEHIGPQRLFCLEAVHESEETKVWCQRDVQRPRFEQDGAPASPVPIKWHPGAKVLGLITSPQCKNPLPPPRWRQPVGLEQN